MIDNLPLSRLTGHGTLSITERDLLTKLAGQSYFVAKSRRICREGTQVEGFFLLISGWAMSARHLGEGRQIVKIHLSGEWMGTTSMALRNAAEDLVAVTDVTVAKVSLERFSRLFSEHPRLAMRIVLAIQSEQAELIDRMVTVGRHSAESRVAAFLLDLRDRLRSLQQVANNAFDIRVTQLEIADLLGLTAVHINRVLRSLMEQGYIQRTGKRIALLDEAALSELAPRRVREPMVDPSWLPEPSLGASAAQ